MVALVERSKWEEVRFQFEAGNYKTLKELAERCQVDYQLLRDRIYRQKWSQAIATRNNNVLQKVNEVKEDLAKEYLSRTYKRALRYEKIIDASQNQQATNNEGIPLLDVDAINGYTLAESRIHDLAKSALRIADAKTLDVTTNGKDLGASFVEALNRLRQTDKTPALTSNEVDKILEMEIIE